MKRRLNRKLYQKGKIKKSTDNLKSLAGIVDLKPSTGILIGNDISMCLNKKCKMRYKCYRYMAIPDKHWQSYASFDYENDNKCFLNILPTDEIVSKSIQRRLEIQKSDIK